MITLHEGDNRDTLRRLIADGVRVHSVVTDPPYGLTSITKRFGKDNAAVAKFGSDGAFKRASAGFMGSQWDGTGIERDPEFWGLIYDILLPGGYCVAFSAARTGHWQACAMEMAGFVMHPFLGWVYGSGFPKAHNASKALVSAAAGLPDMGPQSRAYPMNTTPPTADAAIEASAQWEGWAYGGQALKPALEPIFVGQKPFSEKNGALNLLKHGVGAINIDGCRVPIDPVADASQLRTMARGQRTEDQNGQQWGMSKDGGDTPTVVRSNGRHPANLLHDGSDEVVAMFPAKAGAAAPVKGTEKSRTGDENTVCYGEFDRVASVHHGDTGSAARFFNSFPLDADPVFYQAKATKADRAGSKHPTVKPVALMQWLVRLITPPNGTVLDPFAGSGTTAEAARREGFNCVLMEAEPQFAADIRRRFDLDTFDDLLGGKDEFADLLG